jgi:hypothetical protein
MKTNMIKGVNQRARAANWYKRFHFSDVIILMHIPFTIVVLDFVLIGAAMAPRIYVQRLVISLIAIFSAHQISHFLDETKSRPWGTKISNGSLYVIGFLFMFISIVLGVYLAITVSFYLLLFAIAGIFLAVSYSLELWKERFHNSISFGLSCLLVYLGSFFLQSGTITLTSIIMSTAIGIQGVYIIVLYEATKNDSTSKLSWSILKGIIIMWTLITVALFFRNF